MSGIGTRAADAGESVKAVSNYVGHADAGFTLRTYTQSMPSSDEGTRRACEQAYMSATSGPEPGSGSRSDLG